MLKPEESLDAFSSKAAQKVAEPPREVSLRFGGEVEMLKPLTRREEAADPDPATGDPFRRPAPNRFSWFQSAMAAAAVLGIIVVVLLSAIFIGISDPSVSPDIAADDTGGNPSYFSMDQPSDDGLTQTDEPLNSEVLVARNYPLVMEAFRPLRGVAKAVRTRRVSVATYKPRRQTPRSQIVVTEFIPTTLIIYPENGEIKSRIEPQLASVYQKPLTYSN